MHLVASSLLGLVVLASSALAEPVSLRDVPNTDGAWQEARGVVLAPPCVVRSWIVDYARWPEIFGDVERIEIVKRDGAVTTLRFHSKTFDRHLELRIHALPEGLAYTGRDGDITTEGKIFLTKTAKGDTDVTIQNVAHIGGFLGMLAPASVVRNRQRTKLRLDLTDLQKLAQRLVAAATL